MTGTTRRPILRMTGLAVAALMLAAAPRTSADAPEWIVDPAKSSIGFTGRQMGVPSQGRFKSFTARVKFDPADLAASAVEVIVEVARPDSRRDSFTALCRIDTANEMEYYRNGGILPYVLRKLAA